MKQETRDFVFGIFSYLVFLGSLSFAVLWLADLGLPFSIRRPAPSNPDPIRDFLFNGLLLFGFAFPHSLLARPKVRSQIQRWVGEAKERSLYVLFASLSLSAALFLFRPIPATVWDLRGTWIEFGTWGGFLGGWILALVASFQIGHGELFGLEASSRGFRGGVAPKSEFKTPGLYRWVRHPIMLGFLMGIWSTPWMTLGQLGFSGTLTLYVHLALKFEEHDLIQSLGEDYRLYQEKVPRIVPFA